MDTATKTVKTSLEATLTTLTTMIDNLQSWCVFAEKKTLTEEQLEMFQKLHVSILEITESLNNWDPEPQKVSMTKLIVLNIDKSIEDINTILTPLVTPDPNTPGAAILANITGNCKSISQQTGALYGSVRKSTFAG